MHIHVIRDAFLTYNGLSFSTKVSIIRLSFCYMSQPLASAYNTNRVLDNFAIMQTPGQMRVLKPIFIFSGLTFQHFMHFLFHRMWTFYPSSVTNEVSNKVWHACITLLSRLIICGNHISCVCCRYDFHNPTTVASLTLCWITKKVCLPKTQYWPSD